MALPSPAEAATIVPWNASVFIFISLFYPLSIHVAAPPPPAPRPALVFENLSLCSRSFRFLSASFARSRSPSFYTWPGRVSSTASDSSGNPASSWCVRSRAAGQPAAFSLWSLLQRGPENRTGVGERQGDGKSAIAERKIQEGKGEAEETASSSISR